jgi:signal transduction histidine kinase
MLAWLDAVAGIVWLAVAAAGWRSSRRFAVLAALATVGWFAGNLDDHLLLIHRPLMLHAALAYPDGRVPGRYPRFLLAVSWVAALVPAVGASPGLALVLAGLVAVEAWRRWARPAWGRRVASLTASRAVALLALSLAAPAVVRLGWWPGAVGADVLVAGYTGLVLVAGAVLLTGLVLRPLSRETDAVIELSDATPGETLAALRAEVGTSNDPGDRAVLNAAVALLESNAALQADLRAKVEEVRASRTRLVATAENERRRLERILADGALTYLDELTSVLGALGRDADGTTRELTMACLDEVAHIREDLDQLARGLHPRTLAAHGLATALTELAARSPVPVTVSAPEGRFPMPAETALWYACTEALTNLTKHARGTQATINVRAGPQELVAIVRDDGVGGARIVPGGGLAGLVDRLAAVGGAVAVQPAPGGGAEVRIRVPLR